MNYLILILHYLNLLTVGKAENIIWTSLEVKVWIFIVADTVLNLMQEEFLNKSFVLVALHEREKGGKYYVVLNLKYLEQT